MPCSVLGCGRVIHGQDMCGTHYWRLRHGKPFDAPIRAKRETGMNLSEAFRFHQTGDIPVDECWLWQGTLGANGYGVFGFEGGMVRAHVASHVIFNGEVPDGLEVRHTCDNPPCVNPNHLIVGTHAQNSTDMVERGRSTSGERNPRALLTVDQVRDIRNTYESGGTTMKSLAQQYGVSRSAISLVLSRTNWKDAD